MNLSIITVPYGFAERGRGGGAGPDRILGSGLEARLSADGQRVRVTTIDLPEAGNIPEALASFRANALLAGEVRAALDRGTLPIVLAGNCSTAAGTIAGFGDAGPGVIWLDAHGDFNTPETTTTGYLDGMARAVVAGRCWQSLAGTIPGVHPVPEARMALVGARDLDPREAGALSESPATLLSPEDVRAGLGRGLSALRQRAGDVYLHIDMDVLDTAEGRANAYAAGGGLSTRELIDTLGSIAGLFTVRAVAVTAYDPAYDPEGRVCAAAVDCITAGVSSARPAGPASR